MKYWYNVEIQTLNDHELTDELLEIAAESIGFTATDVDERELFRMTAVFRLDDSPENVLRSIQMLLDDRDEIYYADVLYRSDLDMAPTRVTLWKDNRMDYKTHVIYEEVE